jgi:hypothetical protein
MYGEEYDSRARLNANTSTLPARLVKVGTVTIDGDTRLALFETHKGSITPVIAHVFDEAGAQAFAAGCVVVRY